MRSNGRQAITAYRLHNSHLLGNGSPIGLEKSEICMHIEFNQNTHFYIRGQLKVVCVQRLLFLVSFFPLPNPALCYLGGAVLLAMKELPVMKPEPFGKIVDSIELFLKFLSFPSKLSQQHQRHGGRESFYIFSLEILYLFLGATETVSSTWMAYSNRNLFSYSCRMESLESKCQQSHTGPKGTSVPCLLLFW